MQLVQRLELCTARAAPGGQRRARRVHARSRVDRLLPVVRQVVNEAADQRVRHQPTGRDAAIDHVRFDGLLSDLLAAPAGPLAVDVPVHEELGRDDVELLADAPTCRSRTGSYMAVGDRRPRRCASSAGRSRRSGRWCPRGRGGARPATNKKRWLDAHRVRAFVDFRPPARGASGGRGMAATHAGACTIAERAARAVPPRGWPLPEALLHRHGAASRTGRPSAQKWPEGLVGSVWAVDECRSRPSRACKMGRKGCDERYMNVPVQGGR